MLMHTHPLARTRMTAMVAVVAALVTTSLPAQTSGRSSQQHDHAAGARAAPFDSTKLSRKARAEIDAARRATARFATPEAAEDAGFIPVFGMVPLQGVHYVRTDLVDKGTFDAREPSVLMYAPMDGTPKLVGLAYAYQHPRDRAIPEGFDGPNDEWHAHDELSREIDRRIVMVHLWLVDSPEGPFARHNRLLPFMAAGLTPPSTALLASDGARGERARKYAFALAMATHPAQIFDLVESRSGGDVARRAHPHRQALTRMVDKLKAAERSNDRTAHDKLVGEAIARSDSLVAVYKSTVRSPRARQLLDTLLDEMMGHAGQHAHSP